MELHGQSPKCSFAFFLNGLLSLHIPQHSRGVTADISCMSCIELISQMLHAHKCADIRVRVCMHSLALWKSSARLSGEEAVFLGFPVLPPLQTEGRGFIPHLETGTRGSPGGDKQFSQGHKKVRNGIHATLPVPSASFLWEKNLSLLILMVYFGSYVLKFSLHTHQSEEFQS